MATDAWSEEAHRTIGELATPRRPLPVDTTCDEIDRTFRGDEGLRSVLLGTADAPVLINRTSFYEILSGRLGFGWPLHHGKPVGRLIELLSDGLSIDSSKSVVEAGLQLLAGGKVDSTEDVLVIWPDGSTASLSVSTILAELAGAHHASLRQLASSHSRFESLVRTSSDVIVILDRCGLITYTSAAAERVTGYRPDDLIGLNAIDHVHPDDRSAVADLFDQALENPGDEFTAQFRFRTASDDYCWFELTGRNLLGDPAVCGVVINFRDVTGRRQLEDQLRHQAFHDSLTGLPNRALVLDRAEQMLARCRRRKWACAALLIDLDHFKNVNDVLGHGVGDELLAQVSDRLRRILRVADTVGRLGGDEFVALVEGDSLDAGPEVVGERILDALRAPFIVGGKSRVVTASIGVAAGHRESAPDLLRDADIALYRAKSAGRDTVVVFVPEMKAAVDQRSQLEGELRAALAADQFSLHYQPIFSLALNQAVGAEALLRWNSPERGLVSPVEFIPILEDAGIIEAVGRWVLNSACADAAAWQEDWTGSTVSVNVSGRQLESDQLVDDVASALHRSGLEPSRLVLEITESTLMRDAEATSQRLTALKRLGVRIAIDDFGTGYSSLAYLRAFPVDILKIDRSFVAGVGESDQADALLRSLVQLGHSLRFTTVAEGIEEEHQLIALRQHGCELGQGYLLGRPAPLAASLAVCSQSMTRSR